MNIQPKNKTILFLVAAALLSAILSCNLDETEHQETIKDQYYLINPKSILESISQGKKDIFSPVDTQPEFPLPFQQETVNWSQVDYFHIVNVLHEHVWGETLEGWQLNKMSFALGCTKVSNGFQNGRFEFFKVIKTRERESRITRFIDIDPRSNSVYISETEYYPKLVNWKEIDLIKTKISADDALQIAERNGGKEKRLAVKNQCDISVSFSPDSVEYSGWYVLYTLNSYEALFGLQVNPSTGEYK